MLHLLYLLWVATIGLIVGSLAALMVPGKDRDGILFTMLLGIVGSEVATWTGRLVGLYGQDAPVGFLMSILGAVVTLTVYHSRRRKTVSTA